ncbi:MAG: YitT family protein [Butyrivibrio sp.]|nr:YitT family protein [Butyrivibrio sp.]
MKKKSTFVMKILMIIAGNIIDAAGFTLFVVPSGLITGGTSGLGLFVHRVCGIPVSAFVFIFNVAMLIAGLLLLGKKFAASTVLSSLCYPAAIWLIERVSFGYVITENIFLCTVMGGLLIGAGAGLVLRAGSSSGGMDVPPLIMHKYLRVPLSTMIYILDIIVLFLQAIWDFGDNVLYGVVLVLIYSVVIDKFQLIGSTMMQVKIISPHTLEIRDAIFAELDRGVTLVQSRTGYLEKDTEMLLSVVSNREIVKIHRIVREIDSNAFMIVNRVSEVMGEGFTRPRV